MPGKFTTVALSGPQQERRPILGPRTKSFIHTAAVILIATASLGFAACSVGRTSTCDEPMVQRVNIQPAP